MSGQVKVDMQVGRLAVHEAAALAIGLIGGWWPTASLAGHAGLVGMGVAAAIAVLGLLAGLIILLLRAQAGRSKLAMSFLLTAPVRMFVTLAAAVLAWRVGGLDAPALLTWVAIFYLLLLAAETSWLTRVLKANRTL